MGGVLCPTFVADMLVTAATAGSAGTRSPTSAPGKMRDRKGAVEHLGRRKVVFSRGNALPLLAIVPNGFGPRGDSQGPTTGENGIAHHKRATHPT